MQKPIRVSLAAIAAASLSHCAPSDPSDLRAAPGLSATFVVPLNYETVYANEQQGFLHCMTGSYYSMWFSIHPTIDSARKSASITLVHHGAWKDIWAVVDIQSSGNRSTVRAYTTNHPLMKDFTDVAQRWASGDVTCQQYGITTNQYPSSE